MIRNHHLIWTAILFSVLLGCATPKPEKYFDSPPSAIPSADQGLFERALRAQRAGQLPEAEALWKRFIERRSNSYEAHNNLGEVYYLQDKISQAINEFEIAYDLEPISEKIQYNYKKALKFHSTLLNENGEYDRVISELNRLKSISSPLEQEDIQFKIEKVEDKIYHQVQRVDSIEGYQKFLEKYPNGFNSDSAKRRLQELEQQNQKVSPNRIRANPLDQDLLENKSLQPEAASFGNFEPETEESGSLITEEDFVEEITAQDETKNSVETPSSFEPPPPVLNKEMESISNPNSKKLSPKTNSSSVEIKKSEEKANSALPSGTNSFEKGEVNIPHVLIEVNKNSLLNVRAAPTTKGKIIGKLKNGDMRPLLEEKENWFQIEFKDGKTGWVSRLFSKRLNPIQKPGLPLVGEKTSEVDILEFLGDN